MSNTKIRFPKYAEVEKLQKILQEAFGFFQFKRAIENRITKKQIFIADIEGEIAGVLIFSAKYDQIVDLVVLEEYRGQGIGKKLFYTGCAVTKTKGLRILATADETGERHNSIEFWRKVGFKETGRVKMTKGGYKLVEMTWGKLINLLKYKI